MNNASTNLHSFQSPIVIGATGGSGTRAIQSVLAAMGIDMGYVSAVGDALDFVPFLEKSIDPILSVTRSANYQVNDLPSALRDEFLTELSTVIRQRFEQKSDQSIGWGWKNPRSMYVLPLIADICPHMHYVHVIRDGRDMALAANQNQRDKHYTSLFGRSYEDGLLASIELWAKINLDVAQWGGKHLGLRYHQIRFEDLTQNAEACLNQLFVRLALDGDQATRMSHLILLPGSLGRWQNLPEEQQLQMTHRANVALRTFGYIG